MEIPFVDLKKQYQGIKEEISSAISEVLENAAFIGGAHVKRFEQDFAKFCMTKHCIGVGNGTDALYISLRALDIGIGDEVITAANSFIATSEAVTMTGAKVVFSDIDPVTYNLDITKISEKITPRTKCIIPVHLYGQPADMDPILEIANKNNLAVVEDAAQAHGAQYKNRSIGSLGHMACFSFFPGKNLGAYGDAGAIVTNDDTLALQARKIANHGRTEKYNHEIEGTNSRLDGLQAAVLSVKLKYLHEWTENRRHIACSYNELLKDSPLITPHEIGDVKAVYHLYVVRAPVGKRDKLRAYLQSQGISTGIHYPIALPNLTAYKYLSPGAYDFPEATKASTEILSLPIFPELTEQQQLYIAKNIGIFLKKLTSQI